MDGVLVRFPEEEKRKIDGIEKEVKFPSSGSYLKEEIREEIDKWVKKDPLNNDWTDYPNLFSYLEPFTDNLEEILNRLEKKFKVYILSTAPWDNHSSSSDKRVWIQKHLPNITNVEEGGWLEKRLILSHRKDLNRGRYLIDDRPNNGAAKEENPWAPKSKGIVKGFGDYENQEWIHFRCPGPGSGSGSDCKQESCTPMKDWDAVLDYLDC